VNLLVVSSGVSAVGTMLMDQANGIDIRAVIDAIFAGIFCVFKIILVGLLDFLFLFLLAIVSALLLLICKVPGLGPVLYTFVFPLLVVTWGLVVVAFTFVILPMTLPAIWDGSTVKSVYARRLAMIQSRLVQITLSLILLLIITALVAAFIQFALFSGSAITFMLSTPILNTWSMGLMQIMGSLMSLFSGQGGEGSGYVSASILGGGLLFMVSMAFPVLVYILGINLVYLGAMVGLDVTSAENTINAKMAEAKRRAEEAKLRAEAAAQRAREMTAQKQPGTQANTTTEAAVACSQCGEPVVESDTFCGGCGYKLR
ncbi:MAG TPA: zinc ribbon domain-containing protein, partial [Methyloradius sp.]